MRMRLISDQNFTSMKCWCNTVCGSFVPPAPKHYLGTEVVLVLFLHLRLPLMKV